MNASFADTATGLLITSIEELTSYGGSKLEIREWNALIGIVTAIVGNILISFALNIQRYAHIRLNIDRDRRQKTRADNKSYGAVDYSTEQARIAGERATLNLKAPVSDEEREAGHEAYHNGMEGQSTHSRSSSESTIRQEKNQEETAPSTSYLKSPYWWAGILLMTTGEAGNFLAYGFAPASIVSPLGVVALISNCIIAPWLLKERFRQRDFWGVIVAIGGAVTVVLSAKNSEIKMGPHDVWKAITRWEFEVYLGVTAALIITLMWASGRYGDRTILIDLGLVGLFGAYTALSTKGVASLLSDTLWRALTFPITYLLVFVLVSTALLQIRYVNRALQRFDSTQVIPTQFVLFTLSVIIGSAVLYRDFESATVDRVLKFIGGCALTFGGVYLITSGRSGDENNEDEDGEEEDQPIALVDEEARGAETAASDDDNVGKRRASVSFYDGAPRQNKSRRTSSYQRSSGQQSLPHTPRRFNSNTSSMFSPLTTPGPDSPLLENPWTSSQSRHHLRGSLQSTVSSPILPSEAQEPRPSTSRDLSHQYLLPTSTRAGRPSTLTRRSIARMMPGPLVSPLSNPLSAIVADSLRGLGSPAQSRRKRGLSTLRLSRSHQTSGSVDEEAGLLTPVAKKGRESSRESSLGEGSSHGKRKSESMSMSFGDFFSFKRGKSKRDEGSSADTGHEASAGGGSR